MPIPKNVGHNGNDGGMLERRGEFGAHKASVCAIALPRVIGTAE